MFKEDEKEIIQEDTCEAGTMKKSSRKKMKRHKITTKD